MANLPTTISPPASVAGGVTRGETTASLASSPPGNQTGVAAPGVDAAAVPIGKPGYVFKFAVNSPQGQEERREHERLRKADKRAALARLVEPPPLPPAPPNLAGQLPPAPGAQPPNLDSASLAPGFEPPPVPWQPELLTGLLDELLKAAEEGRVGAFVGKCQEAGITGKLLDEIERDAHFPKGAKILLKESLPRLACKWLNKSGVSSEFRDELSVVTAILLIVQSDRKNGAKLDELIAERKAERAAQEKSTNPPPAVAPASLK